MKKLGKYIVFEGIVGSGKSTQSRRLYDYLVGRIEGIPIILTREPGGSEIADTIRKIVQATQFTESMHPVCEAYLYAASRAQTLHGVVRPVLKSGGIVISDRSFISSLAFQGFGRRLGKTAILEINAIAVRNFVPNIVIYLDVKPEVGLARIGDQTGDKFEREAVPFFERVRRGYLEISRMPDFQNKWITIDGEQTEPGVFAQILNKIESF